MGAAWFGVRIDGSVGRLVWGVSRVIYGSPWGIEQAANEGSLWVLTQSACNARWDMDNAAGLG